jgi:hypothetical protein
MTKQRDDTVPDQARGRVVAGDDQLQKRREQLALVEYLEFVASIR